MSNSAGFTSPQQNSGLEHKSRSVFVGNISYDSSEDELRELFSRVGPIINFKIIHDRDTGKPKGYGFIEYSDPEVAMSAQRNLNDTEFHGRQLRVSITQDQLGANRNETMPNVPQSSNLPPTQLPPSNDSSVPASTAGTISQPVESQYGPTVDPSEAPEAITKTVASLPPEQMYELMTKMKLCIQNNPAEARHMLLQNPQLAYALLQAQIVMKIVDPQVAMAMLHRENTPTTPLMPGPNPLASHSQISPQQPNVSIPGLCLPGIAPSRHPGFDPRNQQPPRFMPPRGMPHPGGRFMPPPQQMRHPNPTERFPVPGGINRPPGAAQYTPTSQGPRVRQPMDAPNNKPVKPEQDQEKAMLIMQVLQLSDEQIALLPPEQRQSIMVLKEQFSKNK